LAEADAGEEGMKKILILLGVLGATFATSMPAADEAQIQAGKQVYEYWCWNCHGEGVGKPGTVALNTKYKGAKPAILDQRTDLTPQIVKYFVRHGVSIMPFFRKTEITDAQLGDLAAYLTREHRTP
jgi:(+)-pinoresinol hydroxylase